MRKTCERHVKKDPYNGSIVHRDTYKVHILFLLVYICFLTFTINA